MAALSKGVGMHRALQAVCLLAASLTPLPTLAQQNALKITSPPAGAQVYLDDAPKGTTSSQGELVLTDLTPGDHKLRLVAPGYQDWTRTVTLPQGGSVSVEAKLNAAVYRVGGGVSPPRATYSPDPQYSELARQAKYQGTVVLFVIVGSDGRSHDIRVQRSLGLGLDEEAIRAVARWEFDPARKNGEPVAVMVNVEINFRLDGGFPSGALRLKLIENALKLGASPKELTGIVRGNGVDFTLDQKAKSVCAVPAPTTP